MLRCACEKHTMAITRLIFQDFFPILPAITESDAYSILEKDRERAISIESQSYGGTSDSFCFGIFRNSHVGSCDNFCFF